MAFIVNGKEPINNTDTYYFIPKHRSKNYKNASQWDIDCRKEYGLADSSIKMNCVEDVNSTKTAYNLLKVDGKLQVVGYSCKRNDLKITKHVKTTETLWHGYPADHMCNQQDRPDVKTLNTLYINNVIDKQEMNRIIRGKRI